MKYCKILLLFFGCFFLFSFKEIDFPQIKKFAYSDPVYKQFEKGVAQYNKSEVLKNIKKPSLKIFRYKNDGSLNLFSFVSHLDTISKDSIITLNRLENIDAFKDKAEILIPSLPGVFVFDDVASKLEEKLYKRYKKDFSKSRQIYIDSGTKVYFFEKERLLSDEFLLLQKPIFLTPVLGPYYVSSPYGPRLSPIDHKSRFHEGVDLAAAEGTPIISVLRGVVLQVGKNAVYGNYITIKHSSVYTTFYAHLKPNSTMVKIGQSVSAGQPIALMGHTGWATGSHLHFEVRYKGKPVNPKIFLKRSL